MTFSFAQSSLFAPGLCHFLLSFRCNSVVTFTKGLEEFVDAEFVGFFFRKLCQILYCAERRHHHPPHLDSLLWLRVMLGLVFKCVLRVFRALYSTVKAHVSELPYFAVCFLTSTALTRTTVSVLSPASLSAPFP